MKEKIIEGGILAIILIVLFALAFGISWIATCGLVKLITICFGCTFKWGVATGVWLGLLLLGAFLKPVNKDSKKTE